MKYLIWSAIYFALCSSGGLIALAQGNSTAGSDVIVRIYSRDDQITKTAVIKSIPKPAYTKQARHNKVEGTVALRVVLASSGNVTRIMPTQRLQSGLTEKAIKAARHIKFEPARVNGHPVSMYFYLNYNFSLNRGVTVAAKDEQ